MTVESTRAERRYGSPSSDTSRTVQPADRRTSAAPARLDARKSTSTVCRDSSRYRLAACAPISTVEMPCSARRFLRSTADKATLHGLSMELTFGLQLIEPMSSAISVGLVDCQCPLRVVTGLEGLQHLQSVGLAVHSTTIIRADGSHSVEAMSFQLDTSFQELTGMDVSTTTVEPMTSRSPRSGKSRTNRASSPLSPTVC
jgi:hypothetical protein